MDRYARGAQYTTGTYNRDVRSRIAKRAALVAAVLACGIALACSGGSDEGAQLPAEGLTDDCQAQIQGADPAAAYDDASNVERNLAKTQEQVAAMFVDTTRQLCGPSFDYSEESVAQLDDLIDKLWDPAVPPSEDELDSLTKLMGAYLGEVMIRNVGGHWSWDPDGRIPVIEAQPGRFAYVLDKVYKRQVIGREHSLTEFYDFYKNQWASAPSN